MNKCQSEAVPVPLAPYPTPWVLGGSACAAAAAGVLGLLTFMGNIVEDKVQKATAPLGVQLVEMEKRILMRFDASDARFKVLQEAADRSEWRLNAIENRLTKVETRLDGIDKKLTK